MRTRKGSRIPVTRPWQLCAALLPSVVWSQPATPDAYAETEADTQRSAPPIEEVLVIAPRTLGGLRDELVRAEDRVHELFNALNDDDEFDIHCFTETRTGTHIGRRVCKANYVDTATANDGQAYLAFLRGDLGTAQSPALSVLRYKNEILRQKLTQLVRENPELREAVAHFGELSENYEDARRAILEQD